MVRSALALSVGSRSAFSGKLTPFWYLFESRPVTAIRCVSRPAFWRRAETHPACWMQASAAYLGFKTVEITKSLKDHAAAICTSRLDNMILSSTSQVPIHNSPQKGRIKY